MKNDDDVHSLSVKALYEENNSDAPDILQLCEKRKLSVHNSIVSVKVAVCITAKGYLFHWTVHLAICRFDQSLSRRDSVAGATGGMDNPGYYNEGSTGERVT